MRNIWPSSRSSPFGTARPLCLFLTGLFACNYSVEPRFLSPVPEDLSSHSGDLSLSSPDLSGSDLTTSGGADLSGGVCSAPADPRFPRRCDRDGRFSGRCDDVLGFIGNRQCTGSGCSNGYCLPPDGSMDCSGNFDADCRRTMPGLTCQVFIDSFGFGLPYWFCASPPVGGNADQFASCEKDSDCAWNICATFAQGRRCVRPCKVTTDCGSADWRCANIQVVLEGQQLYVPTCVPAAIN